MSVEFFIYFELISEQKDHHNSGKFDLQQHTLNDKENFEQHLHHGLRHRSNIRAMLNVPPTLSVKNTQMPPGSQTNDTTLHEAELKAAYCNTDNNGHHTDDKITSKDISYTVSAQTLPSHHTRQQDQLNQLRYHQAFQPKVTLLDDGDDQCDECDVYQETSHDSDCENNEAFITNASTPALHDEHNDTNGKESLFSFSMNLIGED